MRRPPRQEGAGKKVRPKSSRRESSKYRETIEWPREFLGPFFFRFRHSSEWDFDVRSFSPELSCLAPSWSGGLLFLQVLGMILALSHRHRNGVCV